MCKDGECHDRRGVPIYAGDLIRSPHFIVRRHKYYLYHVAVSDGVRLWMVPTSHLEPTMTKGGGRCQLTQEHVEQSDVISGHGPGDCLDYADRPRVACTRPEPAA